jgi:hypothetical protein
MAKRKKRDAADEIAHIIEAHLLEMPPLERARRLKAFKKTVASDTSRRAKPSARPEISANQAICRDHA